MNRFFLFVYFLVDVLLLYAVFQIAERPYRPLVLKWGIPICLLVSVGIILQAIPSTAQAVPDSLWLDGVGGIVAIAILVASLSLVFRLRQGVLLASSPSANQTLELQSSQPSTLQEYEAILHNFYESTDRMMGIVELEEETVWHIFGNTATAHWLGLPQEAIYHRRLTELGLSSEIETLWARFYRMSAVQGTPIQFSYLHPYSEGERYLSATVCPLSYSPSGRSRFSYIAEDITESKASEASLRSYTAQLQQALDFEAMLKRITDKVCDSLDEQQILDSAVQELGEGLGVKSCNASLYDLEAGTFTICYEYTTSMFPIKGHQSGLQDFPEIHGQLLQGLCFQFCFIRPNPIRGRVAILACPLINEQGVFGDLWLVNDRDYGFRDLDLRMVQQVANQCAIALRQARLYQAVQARVTGLELVNRLKDDFLSTVSHELRTPISNMKLAIQMLDILLRQVGILDDPSHKANRYFQILREECQREISLINDLLDLSRLESGTEPFFLESVSLQEWLPHLARPFQARAYSQQQQFYTDISPQMPPIQTDPSVLAGIVAELLTNACKYTPPGECITLAAHVLALETEKSPGWQEHDNCPCYSPPSVVQIEISNTGVEIAPEERDRIFDKFYRIPNSDPWKYGGTGLGLALVKQRLHRIQGTIELQSQNRCTTFSLQLPIELAITPADDACPVSTPHPACFTLSKEEQWDRLQITAP